MPRRAIATGTGTYSGAVARNGLMMLGILTIIAAAFHGAAVYRCRKVLYGQKLESLVQQGVSQLADLGRPQDAAASTSWAMTDGPLAEQFRRWAWSVLRDDDIVAAALLDEQGRTLSTVPRFTGIPGGSFEGVAGEDVPARVVPTPVGDRKEPVWRVAAVTRRDGSAASQAGLLLFARRRPLFKDAAKSSLGLGATVFATGCALLLAYTAWFARKVQGPLRALAAAADQPDGDGSTALPLEREDEIGAVARAMDALLKRAHRTADHLEHLETTMNSRVLDETRQINALLERAERAIWIDPLTKLGNRRLLDDRLEVLFEAQKRTGSDMTIVMLDLDHFKNLNDTHGHSAGDEMLQFAGELLRGALRATDIAVRYGGDEFAVILADTTPDTAAAIAERFVRLFGQRAGLLEVNPPLSMSAGIASMLRDRPESGRQLLDLADRALYKAKSRGRNRLCARS